MPKFGFYKLIRDKLPELYAELGQKATIRTLDDDDYRHALKIKLLEESKEIPIPKLKSDELVSELADLQETIDCLKKSYGISDSELYDAQAVRKLKRGGFEGRNYLEQLDLSENDEWSEYYRKDPEKYPEMTASLDIAEIIALSERIGELGVVKRATLLPGGESESDSHHSLSLALIAYDITKKYCPELDADKLLRYALVHDLMEIVTGDEDTLHATPESLQQKLEREKAAWPEFLSVLSKYPVLISELEEYEKLDSPEAATIFILDKASTTWTHFWDRGSYLRGPRMIQSRQDLQKWHDTQLEKIEERLQVKAPKIIYEIYEQSFEKMRDELFLSPTPSRSLTNAP